MKPAEHIHRNHRDPVEGAFNQTGRHRAKKPLTLDPKTPFGYPPAEATTEDQSTAHYRPTSRKVGKHPRMTINPGRHHAHRPAGCRQPSTPLPLATKQFDPPTGLPPTHNPTTPEPSPNITNQEPAPSSFTPNLGRNRTTRRWVRSARRARPAPTALRIEEPGRIRTVRFLVSQIASIWSSHSDSTSFGVRYPIAEWSRI